MSCVLMLQRGHSGDGCVLASTLCKYDFRNGDLFVLSWARVRRVRRGSLSSELLMCGGGVRSILLLPLVARCLETILGCLIHPQQHAGGVGRQQPQPTSCLVQTIVAHCCEVMYLGCFEFRGELGFLNCDFVVVVCHDQVRCQIIQSS